MLKVIKVFILTVGVWVLASQPVGAQSVIDLKNDYQRDLDIYRNGYSQFVVKKSEYDQFKTYAAEEDLVKAAGQVLAARSDVWIAYWQLLSVKFDNLRDGSTKYKEEWQIKFETEVEWNKQHKARLAEAKTRNELMTETKIFNDRKDDLAVTAFEANAELSVSMIVQTAQALLEFNQGLGDRVNQQHLTAEVREAKIRGLTVNAERIHAVLDDLEQLRTDFKEGSGYAGTEPFTKITQELEPVYLELSQQYQVASELSSGVEW